MSQDYVRTVGRMAYVWGWPLVNMHNRRAYVAPVPEPGLKNGILPVAPIGQIAMLHDYITPDQRVVACPNQDVVYGLGFFALDKGPVVLQVPDFGERFWVYALYNARTDEFSRLGRQYGTKPGFYLVVGPGWKGEAPAGFEGFLRSDTELANAIPRIYMDDTEDDRKAIQPFVSQVMAYPLSSFDGTMKTMDWSGLPHFTVPDQGGQEETPWVDPEKFFDVLPEIMRAVPPLPGEEALYAWIQSVLDAAEQDAEVRKVLQETAISAEQELLRPLFRWRLNGLPAGNGWNSPVNSARFGHDYLTRTAIARSNIFENLPEETRYFFTDVDGQGQQLQGSHLYAITFPKGQLPPVKGFWSLTLYNEHHFFHRNDLERYSLGTKNRTLKYGADGSLTLYAGTKSPGAERESNWLPAPEGTFSLYIRAYWPEEGIGQGTWMPPAIQQVKP